MRSVETVAPVELDIETDKFLRVTVSDCYRSLGKLDRIEAGLLVTVGDINQHTHLVHLFDDITSEKLRHSQVIVLPATGGDTVLGVVSELNDSHPQSVIDLHHVDVAIQRIGVLKAEQDRDSAGRRDRLDVIRAGCQRHQIGIGLEQPIPMPDLGQSFAGVLPNRQGDMNTADTTLFYLQENDPVPSDSLPDSR